MKTLAQYSSISMTDDSMCSDWAGSGATFLSPMWEQGDCSKTRMGAVYGVYNCETNKICLKVTSCVQ